MNKTIQALIKRNSRYKDRTYTLTESDFANLTKMLSGVVKANININDIDRVERLIRAYNMLSEVAYYKQKPAQKEIRNVNMESSPPCNLSMLTYKMYIDRKINKLIIAICDTIEKRGY